MRRRVGHLVVGAGAPRADVHRLHEPMTEAKDAGVMNNAATQNLRAIKLWPVIEQVLNGGPAPSKLAEQAAGLISKWVGKGAHRIGENEPPADPGRPPARAGAPLC